MTIMDYPKPLSYRDSTKERKLWIAGAWRDGRGGDDIPVVDPSTGEEIGCVSDGSVEDGIDAVTAAAQAMPAWAATAPRARSEILRRCFDLMIERKDELAHLISLENGKSLADAQGEVSYAAEFFRWFAEEAVRLNGELYPAPGGANKIMVSHRPIGVSLLITPWNFPAAMATRKIAPALAAGCACVLKPATETPLTAYALVDILKEAGVPDGVVNLVSTRRAGKVVSAMLHDPRVRMLSFTGSTEVGRILLHEAADTIVSCSMELGGNAPLLVFEDADIDSAVDGAMIAKMRNGGEACTAANRFFVHDAVADRFSRALADRMAALKVGPGYEAGTDCGPLINRDAVERLTGLVAEAKARGAKVLCGDHLVEGRGFYFSPTVLVDVPDAATITNAEIFGPIAAISTFSTEEEAIRKANDTEYGLISYVFTGDLSRGLRVCDQMESGMVGLNRGLVSDPAAPFGGAKQSGIGREGAHMGILEFSEVRYVAATW